MQGKTAEIICVGTELLMGSTLNTNATEIAAALEAYRQALGRQDGATEALRKKAVLAWLDYLTERS